MNFNYFQIKNKLSADFRISDWLEGSVYIQVNQLEKVRIKPYKQTFVDTFILNSHLGRPILRYAENSDLTNLGCGTFWNSPGRGLPCCCGISTTKILRTL